MAKAKSNEIHSSALEVLEDATRLLRSTPAGAWIYAFAGGFVFIASLLYFLADMSLAVDAEFRLAGASLGLAVTFAFMKYCHAIFGHCLMSKLRGESGQPPMLSFREKFRLLCSQTFVHCTMPWILFFSSLAMLPLAWAMAFYHSASVLGVGIVQKGGGTSELIGESMRACNYAVAQNHWLKVSFFFFWLMAFLNVLVIVFLLPNLVMIFSGEQNFMTVNPMALFNSSVVMIVFMTAWQIVNPLIRACHAIRCFKFISVANGDDLKASIRALPGVTVLVFLACMLCMSPAVSASSDETFNPRTEQVNAMPDPVIEEFDANVDDVLKRSEFQWRLPKGSSESEEMGWLEKWSMESAQWIAKNIYWLVNKVGKFFDWLIRGNNEQPQSSKNSWGSVDGQLVLRVMAAVLILALIILFVIILRRHWARKKNLKSEIMPVTIVDLENESITATDLPEDEWIKLAREKWASGEHRLALRALFLGGLARLGDAGYLAITPCKTNGIYLRELTRRAHASESLRGAFDENVRVFERVWYGLYPVDAELFERFSLNHENIKTHAQPR